MNYRKLRIAWSVAWGILCLLLIVFWVRSYWRYDLFQRESKGNGFRIHSGVGVVQLKIGGGLRGSGLVSGRIVGGPKHLQSSPFSKVFKSFERKTSEWIVPIWFFVLCSGAPAVGPLLRWRFSLRTLLIAMTLVSAGLGWAVYALR
jgi:hypothetical protein